MRRYLMLKRILWLILLAVWFAPAIAFGAEKDPFGSVTPRGKWWKMPRLAGELDLSDGEMEKLDHLFLSYRRNAIDIKSNIERGWLEIDNLLEQEEIDETAVMDYFTEVNTARSALAAEGFQFLLEVRKVLGADRYQRLKALSKEIRGKRRAYSGRSGGGFPPRKQSGEG
jgi:hypothetical protein